MKRIIFIFAVLVALILLAGCISDEKFIQIQTPTTVPTIITTPVTTITTPKQIVPTPVPTYQPVLYENKEMGFQINYDKTWDHEYTKMFFGEVWFRSPSGKQRVDISKWPYYTVPPPIEEVVIDYSHPERTDNYTLLNSGVVEGSRYPTGYYTSKTLVGNTEFKTLTYLIQTNGNLYILRYNADSKYYDRYESLFKQMVPSFEPI